MYCSNCGKVVQDRFCSSCGTPLPTTPLATTVLPAPLPVSAPIVYVESKRAGWYSVKAFIAALVAAVIGDTYFKDSTEKATWNAVIFGTVAFILFASLMRWRNNRLRVTGTGAAWCFTILMTLLCLGGMSEVFTGATTVSTRSPEVYSPVVLDVAPKTEALRDTRLTYNWSKEGFGSIMMADFTLNNPTKYRFKDFEITCTHFAPSGTQIDSNTRTIYQFVEPHSTKVFYKTDMGFIHSQVATSSCRLTDLVIVE
jgi:hypothetical protein